jgi:hypothetical protein
VAFFFREKKVTKENASQLSGLRLPENQAILQGTARLASLLDCPQRTSCPLTLQNDSISGTQ